MNALDEGMKPTDSWWLDAGPLPTRYWARLRVFEDGSAEVFVLRNPGEPRWNRFINETEARYWLCEDEFESLAGLIEDGEVPLSTKPPFADSDRELVPKMYEPASSEAGERG